MIKSSKVTSKTKTLNTITNHPIHGEPAFVIKHPDEQNGNALVLADLHYGIEHSLAEAGARLPSQTGRLTERIISLCSKVSVSNLVLLGDIKHTVPRTSKQEWYELPEVFERLHEAVDSIDIIPGNHDGGLRKLIPSSLSKIKLHPNSGCVLFDIGFFHGHTWPDEKVLCSKQVLMAHNHPHVLFVDKLGGRASFPCWVRGRLNKKRASDRYSNIGDSNPEIIILPAFNDLGSGTPVNTTKPEFLGPLLKNGMVDTDDAEIYLLDGTALGKLNDLIDLNLEKKLERTKHKHKRFSRYFSYSRTDQGEK
jgi:putative SbcD/Mre11-related phosphoesterase